MMRRMVRRVMAMMLRPMARARGMMGRTPRFVVFRCHALWGAPRPAQGATIAAGRPFVQLSVHCGAMSAEPLAPLRRNWHFPFDRWKATKGRHMGRDLVAGAKAPAFRLPRDGGATVSLADFKGRKLVLYFYPKADTPGCTKEAVAFSALRAGFAKANTDILGVSADSVAAQDKFKAKHKLKISLASDETKAMLTTYGAWGEKSMYGRKFMGVIRKTFLIDAKGTIARIWPSVRVPGHAEEVLEAAKALK
jgi:peroxiredoxin Q/BCP